MTSAKLPTVDLTTSANSSGSNSGVGRATKKVCTRPELHLDKDDPTVDRNDQKVQSPDVSKASYKLSLLGASSEKEQNVFMEEDFALIEGDVLTEIVEGVPSVTFSDWVQEYIEH
ncbi:hypothetical protein Godav_027688 [Gossypium davidsonii]|uniref:Uncharacterized protein n=2 Tax=Gossypium TaxID=3633 RepID=A0A7J8RWV0_GOSDV|nr:hypothetical protein [Gossypium davidsonii]MBA0653691.1 hypothetical protein [Gossypium klotzschianum]